MRCPTRKLFFSREVFHPRSDARRRNSSNFLDEERKLLYTNVRKKEYVDGEVMKGGLREQTLRIILDLVVYVLYIHVIFSKKKKKMVRQDVRKKRREGIAFFVRVTLMNGVEMVLQFQHGVEIYAPPPSGKKAFVTLKYYSVMSRAIVRPKFHILHVKLVRISRSICSLGGRQHKRRSVRCRYHRRCG